MRALGRQAGTSPAALEAVRQALQDEDWRVRQQAAVALRRLAADAAVMAIMLGPLDDPRSWVRWEAALTLADLGMPDPAALAALCRALRDEPYPWVRTAAATALGRLEARGQEVVAALRDACADRDGRVRAAARRALARPAP